jgi:hypothetical protein
MKSTSLLLGALGNLFAVALLLGMCAAARPALAGELYKCAGPNGQVAYTNRPRTFTDCKVVSSYANQPASAHPADDKAHTDYRSESGASVVAPSASTEPADKRVQVNYGAVYKVTKANGITEYTNIRPTRSTTYRVLFTYIANCYACDVHSKINFGTITLNVNAFNAEIAAAAQQYGVDPALLRAVIHAESSFNPNAVSIKGAQGLMQLMPETASDLGVNNPFDAAQNIRGGAQYLAGLIKQFNGDERLATAAYDAGPQNVQKYNGVPPFDETRVYVERVATLRQRYREANPAPVAAAAPAPAGAPRS